MPQARVWRLGIQKALLLSDDDYKRMSQTRHVLDSQQTLITWFLPTISYVWNGVRVLSFT